MKFRIENCSTESFVVNFVPVDSYEINLLSYCNVLDIKSVQLLCM